MGVDIDREIRKVCDAGSLPLVLLIRWAAEIGADAQPSPGRSSAKPIEPSQLVDAWPGLFAESTVEDPLRHPASKSRLIRDGQATFLRILLAEDML